MLKAHIPRSIEFEQSDEAIESLTRGFADLQHFDRTGWANSRDAHEMTKKILRQRALRAGRNIEPIQLVTADDIAESFRNSWSIGQLWRRATQRKRVH